MNRRDFFTTAAGAIAGAALPPLPKCQHHFDLSRKCTKCGATGEFLYFSKPFGPIRFTYRSHTFEAERGSVTHYKTADGTHFAITLTG